MISHTSLHASTVASKKSGKVCLVLTLLACSWTLQSTIARSTSNERVERSRTLTTLQEGTAKTPEVLRTGEPLSRKIKGGETQCFSVSLATGQFAEFSVEQHGSVLLTTLFDPQGQEVIQMDNPGGAYGPIYLSAIATVTGDYRLEINSINRWANPANYEVALISLRSLEVTDRSSVDAQLFFAQGRKNFRTGKAADSIEPFNRGLAHWQASQNSHWQAVTQYALSQAYRSVGNRQKTEECLNETLKILTQQMAPNDWRLKASALNDLGPIYAALGQKEKALSVLDRALTLYAANQDGRGQASALNNLATTHGRSGDYFLAHELVERAIALRRFENDKPGVINLLNSLGAISDRLGEPDRALSYFTQALRAWEELGELSATDSSNVAALLNNLAFESDKLGKWDEALDYYDKALAKYRIDDPNRVAVLDNKGELYAALGHPGKAKECYDEALSLLASSGKPDLDVKAGLLVHLGQLSVTDGDLANAVKSLEDARSLQPGNPKLADILTNLGAVLALQGNLEKAMEVYQVALDIQLKLKDQRGQALTLQKRGEAQAVLRKNSEALDDLKRALVFWKALKDQQGEAATYDDIALVERGRGNLDAALANSDEAIGIIESLRTTISSHLLRTSYFATKKNYYEIAVDLRMQQAKRADGKEHLVAALELSEKARARVLLDALSEAGVGREEFKQTSDPKVAGLIEQRLNLLARLGAKAQARTKLLNGQHSLQQIAAIDKEITAVTEQHDELETKLRSNSPKLASLTKPRPSTLKEIQRQLDDDTLLLEYSLGEKRSYAWAVTPSSIHGFELAPRNQIEPVALRFTEALTARNRKVKNESWPQRQARLAKAEADYSVAAAELSKLIIDPIAAELGQKRLVIVADGALQLVPFQALPVPGAMTVAKDVNLKPEAKALGTAARPRLIDQHEIISLPSASVLALQRRELRNRQRAPFAVAVIADPVFDDQDERVAKAKGLGNERKEIASAKPAGEAVPASALGSSARLPNTKSDLASALRAVGISENGKLIRLGLSRQEAKAIARAVSPSQSFSALDFKASRKTATSSELTKFRIVHFATHGVLDLEHPELSGIVLSMVDEKGQSQNGYLRLHEIYNLNLPAELVVLSACQTGVGKQIKGEGLIALTRGFMYAGAKSVVASLWKVDDASTAELMAEFYRQMFVKKLKPAAALRAAQIYLSQKPRYQSPYYWSGFFIQGEWNSSASDR